MAVLLFTLLFVAIAAGAASVMAHELTRPLDQPWLRPAFAGSVAEAGPAPIDLAAHRLRRDTVARLTQARHRQHAAAA